MDCIITLVELCKYIVSHILIGPVIDMIGASFAVYLGPILVSWSSKKQLVVSMSSTKAKYRALAHATSEVMWIQSLFSELQIQLNIPPIMWCDN